MVNVIPFSKEFSEKTAVEFFENDILSKINVKAVFMGPNHHFGKQREGNADILALICKKKNIEFIITQEFIIDGDEVRSTQIRKYLAQNDWQNAEKLMGHTILNLRC
jgi:riboflavin kinase/FMN adenylyltransferase